MAFSGITVAAIVSELNKKILNGKIQRISQPESLGLVFNVHKENGNHKLYISSNASLPLIYLTKENKKSPLSAYNFVMVLRKHIGNARIISITQMGLERVIRFELEHLDELKDVARKYLYVEIMGKHSNIIFTDENDKIIDAIKHVGGTLSSVREVLPGRDYFIPTQSNRMNPLESDYNTFYNKVLSLKAPIDKAISSSFIGFSRLTGMELAARIGVDSDIPIDTLHESERENLTHEFLMLIEGVKSGDFNPCICYDGTKAFEFSPFDLSVYNGYKKEYYESVSEVIELFYQRKNNDNLIKSKATDLRKLITNHIERTNKKLIIQKKQLEDTKKMDKLRIYGELLQAYGYSVPEGAKETECENYYDNNNLIKIPLDPTLSAIENSKKYFKKYEKLKRTKDALIPQIENSSKQLEHLSTILASLSISENEDDIKLIRNELFDFGFIKKRPDTKKNQKKASLLHFVTEDGFDLYVGKNNYQNDEVTFKIGRSEDWWFHAKQVPGSHVILKTDGKEIPDNVFEQAANLAAYYSSARESTHVEIDYVKRKEIKRVPGAAKGFVIYYTNYSMTASPDISSLQKVT